MRSCIADCVLDDTPAITTVPVDEVSGVRLGGVTPWGSSAPSPASASLSCCLALNTSAEVSNTTAMSDKPWIELERIVLTPGTPRIRVSTGRVTSASTCSAVRPGASVWIDARGGAKSGKTS